MKIEQDGINLGKMLANIENMKSDISDIKADLRELPNKMASKVEVDVIKERQSGISERVDNLQRFMYIATGVLIAAEFAFKLVFK